MIWWTLSRRVIVMSPVVVACSAVFLFMAGCIGTTPPGNDNNNDNGDGGTTPAEFTNAVAARGGSLYDKWWAAAGVAEPTDDHPLWATRPDTESNARVGSDTWRCKECHGWDYKGVDGAYASGSHRTGIAGVFGTTRSAQEVFDLLADADDHAFTDAGLADADIWDLAKFVLEGQIDTDTIIDDQGAFTGVVADGQSFYDTSCLVCHGADGLMIPPGADDDHDEFVGTQSNDNPWEFQHKVRFGQPGSIMPAQFDLLTTDEVGDLGAFSQTLPVAP